MKATAMALISLFILSCSSNVSKPRPAPLVADLSAIEKLGFSGRGAGAGVMLMSSMGPMGIAIGVAIDEGIRKDIESSFVRENGDLHDYLEHTVGEVCIGFSSDSQLVLTKVGFVAKGENIYVAVDGVLRVRGNETPIAETVEFNKQAYELDRLKREGQYSAMALKWALTQICSLNDI